jgi:hypothetical protein
MRGKLENAVRQRPTAYHAPGYTQEKIKYFVLPS